MIDTSVISPQGQTTVPASVRARLGVKPGQKLIWSVEEADQIPVVKVTTPNASSLSSLKGSAGGVYGKAKKAIDQYLASERQSWDK